MKIDYDAVCDIVRDLRRKADEDELSVDETLDLLEKELDVLEYENY